MSFSPLHIAQGHARRSFSRGMYASLPSSQTIASSLPTTITSFGTAAVMGSPDAARQVEIGKSPAEGVGVSARLGVNPDAERYAHAGQVGGRNLLPRFPPAGGDIQPDHGDGHARPVPDVDRASIAA